MKLSDRLSSLNSFSLSIIIFSLALLLRLIYLLEFSHFPLFDTPIMDMEYHHLWATAIANCEPFIDGSFFRAPLYPIFLSVIYYLFGESFWIARLIQIILGSLSAVLVFQIGAKVFDRKVGLIAGLIISFCGPLIFFEAQLLVPALAIFLNLCGLFYLIKYFDNQNGRDLFLAGLFFGLSATARPTILLFALAAVIWLLWINRNGNYLSKAGILLIGILLPIIPVTVHNYVKSGEFTIIGTYSGMNFYIGNNKSSDGISAKIPGTRNDWYGMMEDARLIAEGESGKELTDSEISSFWLKRASSEILDDPAFFIKHLGRKTIFLIQGIELSNNFDFYFFSGQSKLLSLLIGHRILFYPWGLLLPFAVLGLFFMQRIDNKKRALLLFLCANFLAIVLFFVTARYRLPLIPVLAIFAAAGIVGLYKSIRQKPVKEWIIPATVTVILLLFCNIDFYDHRPLSKAQGFHTTASLYARSGRTAEAEQAYRQAIAADSSFSQSYNDLALMLGDRGRSADGASLIEKALNYDQSNFLLYYNLGYLYLRSANTEKAIEPFQRSLTLRPNNLDALNNIALAYQYLEKPDSAAAYYKKIVEADYFFPEAAFNLGFVLQNSGHANEAIRYFEIAAELDPTNAEAFYNLGMIYRDRQKADSSAYYLELFLETWTGDEAVSDYARQVLDSLPR